MASTDNKLENNETLINEFRLGMADFNGAMKSREDLSLRIARRTTQLIRFTLIGLVVLGLAMFVLIWTLTSNMSNITSHMSKISGDMRSMRADFHQVAVDVTSIRKDFSGVRGDYLFFQAQIGKRQNY